ncbi:hypothetical protein [Lignipirellula cremea]|uniref:Uncharacterized protein n=1 Tax=Lignipirellula cremea TaxID=2528010 RepID=A0A518DTA6_9BACT|nr:hypothetical protein [Lignipirellula cremea]QDU95054.1 hypothetical protein Pla8534_28650 [Lignipirellula cremea]
MNDKAISPRALNGFAIYQPGENWQVLLAEDHSTSVAGKYSFGTTLSFVRVQIFKTQAEADAARVAAIAWGHPYPPPNWETCLVETDGTFRHANVPAGEAAGPETRVALFWASVGGSNEFKDVTFTVIPFDDGVAVTAKACIWYFGVAPGSIAGPYGEGAASQPIAFPITPGATSVQVTAAGGWRKRGGGPLFGPNGNPSDHNALVPCNNGNCGKWYDLEPTPGGHPIEKIDGNKGLLVGVWDATEGTFYPQHPIGEKWGADQIPAGATNLYLGFHDGFQWTNNDGLVRVKVVFS